MMELQIHGNTTWCYSAGKAFDPAKPTVIFLHGALNDHSVWILQTRYLAHHGWNVLAPDLPGHGKSAGPPPGTVEAGADFVLALMDACGLQRAVLVGHSFGSLIALAAAARAGHRISHLVLVGTAFPMKVSQALLDGALHEPLKAIDLVNRLSHSTLAPPPSTLGPGTWVLGGSRALMRRVLASNPKVNVFYAGFKACDDYRGGEAAIQSVSAPTLFILGKRDQMTPPKAAQSLIAHARNASVTLLDAGHQLMAEAPDGVLMALREFIAA